MHAVGLHHTITQPSSKPTILRTPLHAILFLPISRLMPSVRSLSYRVTTLRPSTSSGVISNRTPSVTSQWSYPGRVTPYTAVSGCLLRREVDHYIKYCGYFMLSVLTVRERRTWKRSDSLASQHITGVLFVFDTATVCFVSQINVFRCNLIMWNCSACFREILTLVRIGAASPRFTWRFNPPLSDFTE